MRKVYDKTRRHNNSVKPYIFSSLTVAGLLVAAGLVVPSAHAVDCTNSGTNSAYCDTIINLILPTSISITGSPSVSFNSGNDLTPGVFYTSDAIVYVTTNSANGYTLSMQMSENQTAGSTNTLYNSATEYIPSTTTVKKQADFENDPVTGGWGFALDATNYRPLPTVNGSTYNTLNLKRTHNVANNDSTTLTFGVLPPTGVVSATYQNIVTVSATANDAIVLTSLTINGTPVKTHYAPGEYFNTSGLTIYANYSDGKQVLLTDGQYVVNNGNPLTAGQTAVSISYTDNGSSATGSVNGLVVDNNIVDGDPVDNGTGNNNGASNGVITTNSSSRGASSNNTNGGSTNTSNDPGSGNVAPQGVNDRYGSSSSTFGTDEDNTALVIILGIATATAATGIVLLAAAKRRREEEEEEEEDGGDIAQMS